MGEQLYRKVHTNTWEQVTWNGFTNVNGKHVWTDGTDIYYSNAIGSAEQYKLNRATSTWEPKTWKGLTSFYGSRVWTDGTDVYYSYSTNQYKLNKATSTWEKKTWNGCPNGYREYIWTDGTDIYYSNGSAEQYKLNRATSTWEPKTWNGFTNVNGKQVWTDGTDIYYSNSRGSEQYKLNKATSTWEPKTWNGYPNGYNDYIWTAGTDAYYSYVSDQYKLDKATSTWEPVTWNGFTNVDNDHVWTDGTDTYYSNGSDQYKLKIDYEPVTIPEPVEVPPSMKVKDKGGIWYPVKGVSVRTHGGSGPAGIASLPPTGAYISSYDPCLAFLGIDETPKYIGANYSDVDPWEDCSGEYIAEQKAYLSGSPYDGPNNIGDWYFLKVGDKVLAKSNSDSGFAPLIEFTEVPVTGMSLAVGGAAVSPGTVTIPEGDSPAVQVTTGSDSTKQYYYCNSDWFNSISESTTDSIGSVYAGGNTLLIEIDPTNHTIGIAKYVYEAGN